MTNPQTEPGLPAEPTAQGTEPALPELPLERLMREAEDDAPRRGKFERPREAKKPRRAAGKPPRSAAGPPRYAAPPASGQEEEEDAQELAEYLERKKRHPALRRLLAALLILTLLLSLGALAADQWLRFHHDRGKAQLQIKYDPILIKLPEQYQPPEEAREIEYDDGKTVTYNGQLYRLNENLATLLFMGIDRENLVDVEQNGNGGQADVLVLVALDTKTGVLNMLSIPRDCYAEFELYSGDGNRIGFEKRQICLAYAYGDGREESCRNTMETVRRLLYGMPISKYLTLEMEGVLVANEAVGGVTVKSLEDMKMPDGSYVSAGQEITLHGQNCERYIRTRGDEVDANAPRMERQKQYIREFVNTTARQALADFGVVSRLYDQILPYLISDLDLSDVVFLAQTYLEHGLTLNFHSIRGDYDELESLSGEINSVFYPDEQSLFEAVLAMYYVPVDG